MERFVFVPRVESRRIRVVRGLFHSQPPGRACRRLGGNGGHLHDLWGSGVWAHDRVRDLFVRGPGRQLRLEFDFEFDLDWSGERALW